MRRILAAGSGLGTSQQSAGAPPPPRHPYLHALTCAGNSIMQTEQLSQGLGGQAEAGLVKGLSPRKEL